MNQLKRINIVFVVSAMALVFVTFNIVHAIHLMRERNERRTSWAVRQVCRLQLEEIQLADGKVKYLFPRKNGPVMNENEDPIIDPRTKSPYIWASVDAKGNQITWDSDDQTNRFVAHSEKTDVDGKRWFIFFYGGNTQLLSDDEVNWDDHTLRVQLP